MSIDEAIARAREVAEKNRKDYEWYSKNPKVWNDGGKKQRECLSCAEEHEQLAEWLEELKTLRHEANELRKAGYAHGYNKAIDDFVNEAKKRLIKVSTTKLPHKYLKAIGSNELVKIAEQLKAGGENGKN